VKEHAYPSYYALLSGIRLCMCSREPPSANILEASSRSRTFCLRLRNPAL